MKKAVFSFFTLRTSGDYPWWDEFPIAIGDNLKRNGIDHLYFYRDYSANSKVPFENRYRISHQQIRNPFTVKNIIDPIVKRYDKVILHSHDYSFGNALWIYNRIFLKKFHWIMTDHNGWWYFKPSIFKRQFKKILRKYGILPEVIIGCSKATQQRLQKIYGNENVNFVYNGIKIPDIRIPEPLSEKPTKALFIGRLEDYKGLWPLVNAFKLIKERRIDCFLTIAGDGRLKEQLQEYIKKEELEKYINLLGHSNDVKELYQKHNFTIIPSLIEENFTVTSLESLEYYLPCIYTNSGGLSESQENYKTGIMVYKNNPVLILEAIRFFQDDIGRFNRMRFAARERASNFTMDIMADNYLKLYLELFKT